MPSALEKARQDPNSMKARILAAARGIFGEYGYSETTTRKIAKNVGIDISTLYYHWAKNRICMKPFYRTSAKRSNPG